MTLLRLGLRLASGIAVLAAACVLVLIPIIYFNSGHISCLELPWFGISPLWVCTAVAHIVLLYEYLTVLALLGLTLLHLGRYGFKFASDTYYPPAMRHHARQLLGAVVGTSGIVVGAAIPLSLAMLWLLNGVTVGNRCPALPWYGLSPQAVCRTAPDLLPWVYYVGSLAAAIGAFWVGVILISRNQPPPVPPPSRVKRTWYEAVVIQSDPAGAHIFDEDGAELGLTDRKDPYAVARTYMMDAIDPAEPKPDTIKLIARKLGYKDTEHTLTLRFPHRYQSQANRNTATRVTIVLRPGLDDSAE